MECQSLQPPPVSTTASIADGSPAIHHDDVMSASGQDPAAASDIDEDDDEFDENAVMSRHAPASYMRHARMSICKMTSDYIRRLPSAIGRKDRSATRRERKATKTLAIVLGQ